VPLRDKTGAIIGVLDVDSKDFDSFDEVDAIWLQKILLLITNHPTLNTQH
jgi:GAF domain-containing protein